MGSNDRKWACTYTTRPVASRFGHRVWGGEGVMQPRSLGTPPIPHH